MGSEKTRALPAGGVIVCTPDRTASHPRYRARSVEEGMAKVRAALILIVSAAALAALWTLRPPCRDIVIGGAWIVARCPANVR
jgi:hypothetical protein